MLPLKDRLLQAEADFFFALDADEEAMSAFAMRWEQLLEDVDSTMESSGLDEETATLVHTTALRIATYVEASVEVLESYNALSVELVEQVEILMSDLAFTDPVKSLSPSPSPTSPSSSDHSNLWSTPEVIRPSRKRRRDSRTTSPDPASCKRRCLATTVCPTATPTRATPLRAATIASSTPLPAASSSTAHLLTSRKRRLSETDTSPPPLPSKRLHVGPRLHAVSDSFLIDCSSRPTKHQFDLSSPRRVDNTSSRGDAPLTELAEAVVLGSDGLKSPKFVEIGSLVDSVTSFTPRSELDAIDAFLSSIMDPVDADQVNTTPHHPHLHPISDPLLDGTAQLALTQHPPSPSPSIEVFDSCTPDTAAFEWLGMVQLLGFDVLPGLRWDIEQEQKKNTPEPQIAEPVDYDYSITGWTSLFDCTEPFGWSQAPQTQYRPLSPFDFSSDSSSESDDDASPISSLEPSFRPSYSAHLGDQSVNERFKPIDIPGAFRRQGTRIEQTVVEHA